MYGEFPVKSVTHVGTPILYDPRLTPDERRDTVPLYYCAICILLIILIFRLNNRWKI